MTGLLAQDRSSRERNGLVVLVLLAILLVSGVNESGWVRLVAGALNLAVLFAAFGVPAERRGRLTLAGFATVGAIGSVMVARDRVDGVAGALGASAQVVVIGAITLSLLAQLTRHQTVTTQTLLGAVASYLLLGQLFAWVYLALPGYLDDQVVSPAATGEIPLYYSYVVLTTLGFGDISPVGALAQRITVVEVLVGQLYLAILISRLVSVWSRGERSLWTDTGPVDADRS